METSKGKIQVNTLEDYKSCLNYGLNNPLIDSLTYNVPIESRIEIQNQLFKNDIQFYKYCWNYLPHFCQETGLKLRTYSASFVSHILSRGAFPEMRFDIRNVNILSLPQHHKWESELKVEMYIYKKNQATIMMLKNEYRQLK